MKLTSPQKEIYASERFSILEAQRLAQEIAFWPYRFPNFQINGQIWHFSTAY